MPKPEIWVHFQYFHCDIFVEVRARLLRFSWEVLVMTGILPVQRHTSYTIDWKVCEAELAELLK